MSKKCKKTSKLKNLQRKRARKAANKARWQTMAQSGENTKSKRFLKGRQKNRKAKRETHIGVNNCGNPSCTRCFRVTEDGHIRRAA